jgi:NAD(P)-dependent dehydrogenase (short-subunit alcohol dehydrogenase family)
MAVILITGSSTGIGYATAETFASSGHTVYAPMRNPQRSPPLQQFTDKNNLPIAILPMDVLNDQSVQNTINLVLGSSGRIAHAII